jgi:hypothetical protein
MSEPPEIQLTRDYATLKILLHDPGDRFDLIRRLYEGSLSTPKYNERAAWLAKRSERSGMFKSSTTIGAGLTTLQTEARRIDQTHHTTLADGIDAALIAHDRTRVEAALRHLFGLLIDELLSSIQQRLHDPGTVVRGFAYVRRYYALAFEAHLAVRSPAHSRGASAALDAMARALEDLRAGATSAGEWFLRERESFTRTIFLAIEQDRNGSAKG